MGGLAWWQVRLRPTRSLALIPGLLVAASAFTVLTAASKTSQLKTGTVSANFTPAYDILVRPAGHGQRTKRRPARFSRTSSRGFTAGSRWPSTTRSARSRGSRSPPDSHGRLRIALRPDIHGSALLSRAGPAPAVPHLHHLDQRRGRQPSHPSVGISVCDAEPPHPRSHQRGARSSCGPVCSRAVGDEPVRHGRAVRRTVGPG